MNAPLSESQLEPIRNALFQNRKIEAIKLYRGATNVGLAEAKNAVEKLEAELRASSPEKFSAAGNPNSGRGCLGVVMAVCVLLGVIAFLLLR